MPSGDLALPHYKAVASLGGWLAKVVAPLRRMAKVVAPLRRVA